MIVTVNTDASFSPRHKIGAYAFWIVSDQGRIMKSGPLKEAVNPIDAELRCIANALHALLQANYPGVHKIIINSDCLHAFKRIGRKKPTGSPERKVADLLRKFKEKYRTKRHRQLGGPIHEFRHVKAHVTIDDKRKWVNDWCDQAAKNELRKMHQYRIAQEKIHIQISTTN